MDLTRRAALAALLLAGCGLSSVPDGAEEPGSQEELELAAGEERPVPGSLLRIGFAGVGEDSRCPTGVTCVWEGNAAVELGLTVGTGPTRLHVLGTAVEPRSVVVGDLRVSLLAVTPYPREGVTIAPEEYRARLRVERVSP